MPVTDLKWIQGRTFALGDSDGRNDAAYSQLVERIQEVPAIATGGWKLSARLKIRTAGIGADELPAAFAEDGPSREAIVRAAIERASLSYKQSTFEKIVSVGDAVWDVHTVKRLDLPFVGVGHDGRAARLRQLGASHVIEDFLDYHNCLWCLEEVRGLRRSGGPV